ncbi:hypothetical protein CK503_14760 [Aliifodinibius salipaludis]|uniref:Uncharacterized protein n=1 Tax=Fodinibius salipaludis TaxID=2032627 RepID=A0A2A2G7G3_9BACT|nr:hypothetical protein [Aliifodinibius salipaludis]PAU92944.1 hypothetical protein CK503_14760 [Aliifodinibius salipaludis]
MNYKLSVLFGVFLFLTTIFSTNLFAQSPAKYICDKFNGELSESIEGRSFVGETYRCDVKEQWDMMIQSEINDMIINDEYFGNSKEWKQTYVDSENYNRRSFSFESDEYSIVNLYIPYEQKTDHFFIAQ